VLARAPEIIVTGTDAPDVRTIWQRFPRVPAVQRGALIRMNADTLHRPTPRLLEGVTALCLKINATRGKDAKP
jgi:iron complex transport system substrate-binding protein